MLCNYSELLQPVNLSLRAALFKIRHPWGGTEHIPETKESIKKVHWRKKLGEILILPIWL